MEFLGDLERAFATWIYPNRVAVAVAVALGLAGLVAIARRRRWDLAARRHPMRALVALALVLVIGGPLGWYLGSPLFLSSAVDEAPPVVAGGASPSPSGSRDASPGPGGSPSPDSSPNALAPERSGTFTGADEFHFGEGTARLIETAPGVFAVRLEDFAVRNGPDLYVYLSPSADGYADGAVELGQLKADRGNQNYEVPAGLEVAPMRSVVIWCKQFAVQFATAPLG